MSAHLASRRHALITAALLALLGFVAPPGLAANPLDDDAGSGMDASDHPALGIPVAPGTIEGRLTDPYDHYDHYQFQAVAGQLLKFSVSGHPQVGAAVYSHGDPALNDQAGAGSAWPFLVNNTLLIAETGTWYFRVHGGPVNLVAQEKPYALTFSLSQPAGAAYARGEEAWHVVEVVAEQPVELVLRMQVEYPHTTTKPLAANLLVERDGPGAAYTAFVYTYRGSLSSSVQAGPLPTLGLPDDLVVAPTEEGATGLLGHYPGFQGSLRAMAYSTTPGTRITILAWADGTLAAASASGEDGVVAWSQASQADVLLPVLSISGPRSHGLDVEGRFVGFANAGRAEATLSGPNAENHALRPQQRYALLRDPSQGTWTLNIGPANGIGYDYSLIGDQALPGHWGTKINNLDGFYLPDLGLLPLRSPNLDDVPGVCEGPFFSFSLGLYDYPTSLAGSCGRH